MQLTLFLWAAAAAGFAWGAVRLRQRIALSRAKHRSLAGHSRIARRIARLIPGYAYDEQRFFSSDDATPAVAARRRAGFDRLCAEFERRHPIGTAMTSRARASLSDLQLTGNYRVPFQYVRYLRGRLTVGAFVQASSGQVLRDVDGNPLYDLTGSYGVNLLGYDAYKRCIDAGAQKVRALGPVLGSLHPCVIENVERLRRLSGLDEVSFHMSGTEAVMQAVRLARYHTRRSHVVRFAGAYHGWWEDVQPGPGNPSPVRETYTLAEGSERTLHVLATRTDIACVLVNPLQALHPNANAPGDSTLVDSSRRAGVDRIAYTAWLRRLREVCTARGIVLIFDEVFTGFRLARGGAQEYFGVRADMVTYGKTLGGGLPVGVVCGRADLMRRFREERPADLCFARGTFNAHPYVMGAMNAFLEHFDSSEVRALYDGLDARWNARAARLNAQLRTAGMPVRVAALSTIWTVLYTRPSRYNWMLQFYLRLHGLALSWVGTGRLIFSLDYDDDAFEEVLQRFVRACRAMHEDGWWDGPVTDDRSIRRSILAEMLREATRRRSAPRAPHRVEELAAQQRQR
jgi:glutamate-1-semialdehyde 2,1-aminomutase